MLAQAILANPSSGINLKGILVGNGAVATGDWYEGGLVAQRMQHAYNHGLFSDSLKAVIDAACNPNWVNRSSDCNAALNTMADQVRCRAREGERRGSSSDCHLWIWW
jgi:hypothetical protein